VRPTHPILILLALPVYAAPIPEWQPWINVTGYNPSYTFVPVNPDHTWKAEVIAVHQRLAARGFRMMDVNQTVDSPLVNWTDRPLTDFGPTGASYETTAQLAVQTGRPLWLNIPAKATPDFARRMGQLFGERIPRNVTGNRVEYGNEFWNGGDQKQGTWNLLRARDNPAWMYYSDTEKMSRQAAVSGLELVEAFRAGWAGTGRTDPVTWEWGGFAPNPFWTFWAMDELAKRGRNVASLNVRNSVAVYVTGSPTDAPITGDETPAEGLAKLRAFADVNAKWAADNQAMSLALGMGGTDVYEGRLGTSGGIVGGRVLEWWLDFQDTPEARELQQGWRGIVAALGKDAAINLEGVGGIAYSEHGQFSILNWPGQFPNGTSQTMLGLMDVIDVPEPNVTILLIMAAVLVAVTQKGRAA
jgi:hypothetical protein